MVEDMFQEIRDMEKGCHGFNSPSMTELLDELEDELIQHVDEEKADSYRQGWHQGKLEPDSRGANGY